MIRSNANVILDIIECATDGNWPNTKVALEDMGYNGTEIEAATSYVAKLVGRTNPISAADFD